MFLALSHCFCSEALQGGDIRLPPSQKKVDCALGADTIAAVLVLALALLLPQLNNKLTFSSPVVYGLVGAGCLYLVLALLNIAYYSDKRSDDLL